MLTAEGNGIAWLTSFSWLLPLLVLPLLNYEYEFELLGS